MKKSTLFFGSLLSALAIVSCGPQNNEPKEVALLTADDTASYAYGISLAENLKNQDVTIDPSVFKQGMEDVSAGNPKMDQQEANTFLNSYFKKKQEEANAAKYGDAKQKGTDFLAEKSKEEGVQTTSTGLKYKVLTEGTGAMPTATDKVTVHYKGTLIDGTQFDSSYDRGEPASFPVSGVIPGWTEALQLMKEGAKYELYIPQELAYGERGAGQSIPPFSTLVFEVELIKVN